LNIGKRAKIVFGGFVRTLKPVAAVLIILCLLLLGLQGTALAVTSSAAPAATTMTRSFDDWKAAKIRAAKAHLAKSKSLLADHKKNQIKNRVKDANIQVLESQVSQDEFNLEVSQGLSITDYLVLYLSAQPGSAKFKDAAIKLSLDETAKVLEAYLKSMRAQQEDKQTPRRSSEVDLFH
jgi:hypothetical protein